MAKISQAKKSAKAKSNGDSRKSNKSQAKKQKLEGQSDSGDEELDDDEDQNENLKHKSENKENETKSALLNDCKIAFGTINLYEVLNLDKSKATLLDIKKAYYKLSLKCHPDKVTDESLKEESKLKFQVLGKIYSVLSDEEKKKIYDECGLIDGEDDMFLSDEKDWEKYFKTLFKKVSKDDIDAFFEKYRNSEEEHKDLIEAYEKYKGDMDQIMIQMYSRDILEDEPRFKEILNKAIEDGEIKKYDLFAKETKKKANKRTAKYEKEAKEAEELRKEMGIDETQDSLRNAILSRRKEESNKFLDNLASKYSKIESNKKTKKGKSKVEEEESDEEAEEDIDENEEDEEEEMSEEEKPKKKSSIIKRKSSTKSKATTAKTNSKKVKRL